MNCKLMLTTLLCLYGSFSQANMPVLEYGKANVVEHCINQDDASHYANFSKIPVPIISLSGVTKLLVPVPYDQELNDKITSKDCRIPIHVLVSSNKPSVTNDYSKVMDLYETGWFGFGEVKVPYSLGYKIKPIYPKDDDIKLVIPYINFKAKLPKTIIEYGAPVGKTPYPAITVDSTEGQAILNGLVYSIADAVVDDINYVLVTVKHSPLIYSYYIGNSIDPNISLGNHVDQNSVVVKGKYPIIGLSISGIMVDPLSLP